MIFFKSIFIGMFAVFPGLSGSALAISLNIYDQLFYSLKDIRKNKKFLLKVSLGLLFGIIIGSNIILRLSNMKNVLYFIFIGLIISDLPFMLERTKKNGNINYIALIISFAFSSITFLFYNTLFSDKVSFTKMIIGGLFFSFGKIFPGVSSSFFLIILGIYEKIIICFSNPLILITDFFYYFPFIIGCVLGVFLFVKLYNYLLLNHYNLLYSILIGFMLSSIIPIFPKTNFTFTTLIGIFFMMISLIISFKLHIKKRD